MQPIQLFVPTFRIDETLEAIRECLEKGWTGLGFKTLEFEKAWKAYTGLPYAHFLNSATSGLNGSLPRRKRFWPTGSKGVVPFAKSLPFLTTMRVDRNHGLSDR